MPAGLGRVGSAASVDSSEVWRHSGPPAERRFHVRLWRGGKKFRIRPLASIIVPECTRFPWRIANNDTYGGARRKTVYELAPYNLGPNAIAQFPDRSLFRKALIAIRYPPATPG